MFYDLNIPWASGNEHNLTRTLAFCHELGYNVVALNHTISGRLPTDLTNPITTSLITKNLSSKLTVLRRMTLVLTESHQNARLAALAKEYDLLAVRPIDERTLQIACSSLDCDIISLDMTQRFPFYFKYKMLSEAIKSGKRFEICYSQGVLGVDPQGRRNLISNATQLIRASRGRGLIICSESKAGANGLRGPWDAINLTAIWGLGQEKGYEAMSKQCRSLVVSAKLKRTSYRGVIDVVYEGEHPEPSEHQKELNIAKSKGKQKQTQQTQQNGQKRKAEAMEGSTSTSDIQEPPISKREAKRRALRAKEEAHAAVVAGVNMEGVSQSEPAASNTPKASG